nr:hypothetical protein Iba_chr07aCG6360 [Ipomoea batatas]
MATTSPLSSPASNERNEKLRNRRWKLTELSLPFTASMAGRCGAAGGFGGDGSSVPLSPLFFRRAGDGGRSSRQRWWSSLPVRQRNLPPLLLCCLPTDLLHGHAVTATVLRHCRNLLGRTRETDRGGPLTITANRGEGGKTCRHRSKSSATTAGLPCFLEKERSPSPSTRCRRSRRRTERCQGTPSSNTVVQCCCCIAGTGKRTRRTPTGTGRRKGVNAEAASLRRQNLPLLHPTPPPACTAGDGGKPRGRKGRHSSALDCPLRHPLPPSCMPSFYFRHRHKPPSSSKRNLPPLLLCCLPTDLLHGHAVTATVLRHCHNLLGRTRETDRGGPLTITANRGDGGKTCRHRSKSSATTAGLPCFLEKERSPSPSTRCRRSRRRTERCQGTPSSHTIVQCCCCITGTGKRTRRTPTGTGRRKGVNAEAAGLRRQNLPLLHPTPPPACTAGDGGKPRGRKGRHSSALDCPLRHPLSPSCMPSFYFRHRHKPPSSSKVVARYLLIIDAGDPIVVGAGVG